MQLSRLASVLIIITATPLLAAHKNQLNQSFEPEAYCVYDLGRLPGLPAGDETDIDVRAINSHNEVVGWTAVIIGTSIDVRAFIWDQKHGMRDLGSLPDHDDTVATDINNAGTVVGSSTNFDTGEDLSFIWTKRDGIRQLDVSLGGVESFATGINRSGQIVGTGETAGGDFHAFLREKKGNVVDLGVLPGGDGSSSASAVNDLGHVTGVSDLSVRQEGFIWDEENGIRSLIPSSTLAVFPNDINKGGEVVGETIGPEEITRAFRWTEDEGLQYLGTLSGVETDFSTASGINLSGMIVGASETTQGGPAHAFIWTELSGMRDLNELIDPTSQLTTQPVLVIAKAINNAGAIVANGFIPGDPDPRRSFLLVPQRHSGNPACQ